MATSTGGMHEVHGHFHRPTLESLALGSVGEALGGVAAVVLSILGLAGLFPVPLLSVAVIALGAALITEGWGLGTRIASLQERVPRTPENYEERYEAAEFGVSMSVEMVGGVTGIVLGVLALLGIQPMILLPAAAVVYGAAMIFGSGVMSRVDALMTGPLENRIAEAVSREAILAATGAEIFVGLGSVLLGIVGLVGTWTLQVTLVATLITGAAIMFGGSAISAHFRGVLHH